MRRNVVAICTCVILCVFLFVVITPVASSGGHSEYEFTPKGLTVLVIGWGLIIVGCVCLAKFTKRDKNPD
jgi:hypothetical protein